MTASTVAEYLAALPADRQGRREVRGEEWSEGDERHGR